jgi:hypothetical protein
MAIQRDTLSAKVQASFQQLTKVAADLNSVSDEMGKCIVDLDAELKRLNLGVTRWTQIRLVEDEQTGDYEAHYLGYAKVNGRWGISLSTTTGNHNYNGEEPSEEWLFNEGPRELRLVAIEKIPDLFIELSQAATKMIEDVRAKLGMAQEVAQAIRLAPIPVRTGTPLSTPPVPKLNGGQK